MLEVNENFSRKVCSVAIVIFYHFGRGLDSEQVKHRRISKIWQTFGKKMNLYQWITTLSVSLN
jgi:hypothetical protein